LVLLLAVLSRIGHSIPQAFKKALSIDFELITIAEVVFG
jgi:hypothetical protein